jgi:TolB-like protein/DNA-binding winged helix-turn-helix (wHTH) protein/cytochrome c-type biogenesis protein CcmH/NrfG
MSQETRHCYEFGPFQLDPSVPLLLREGRPVALTLKALETLIVLVERGGQVVSREELIEAIWPDTAVEENNLSVNVSALRKVLGESNSEEKYIETVPRRGYRFTAPVRVMPGERAELIYTRHTHSQVLIEESSETDAPIDTDAATSALTVPADAAHALTTADNLAQGGQPRRKLLRWPVMLALAVVVALAVGASFVRRGWQRGGSAVSGDKKTSNGAGGATSKSVAVLPIKNLTGDEENAYLADGLTESLMTELSTVHGLRVISHNSTFAFKNKEATPREVADRLGVTNLIEGSVRRDGDTIRVETRLVNAASGEVIWSGSYERQLEDIITMQDGIACSVASELQANLCGQKDRVSSRYAQNIKAYRAYMKGRFYWYQRGDEPLKKAIASFEEALQHDPDYALAYAGLAETYVVQEANSMVPPGTALPKVAANAEKALRLDPNLPGAYAALGLSHQFSYNFAEAERMLQRAVEANPNYATAWQWRAHGLRVQGKYTEAEAAIKRAQELDPLSVIINQTLGEIYYSMRQPERVLAQAEHLFRIAPDNPNGFELLVEGHTMLGHYDEALAAAEKNHVFNVRIFKIFILAEAGRREEARRLLAEEEKSERAITNPYRIGIAYALLGNKDQAFVWLEKAYTARQASIYYLKCEPRLDSLRSDPRYADLLKRMNLAD